MPQGRYADVVRRLRPHTDEPGDVIDLDGRVLGTHAGVMNFTVGQRKGLGLSGTSEPLFVTRLDAVKRRVVVGPRKSLDTSIVTLSGVNWLGPPNMRSIECLVKVRSTRPPAPAHVELEGHGSARVRLLEGGDVIAPGQACVFYETGGTRVLGGGWINAPQSERD